MQVALACGTAVQLTNYLTRHLTCAPRKPAVTLPMVLGGRMQRRKLPVYFVAQLVGAILAGLALYLLFSPSIAAYEAAHGIVRGTEASIKTAMMFGEFY